MVCPRLEKKLRTQPKVRNLYSSPCVIGMAKSEALSWDGHVERMGAKKNMLLVG
jgi:hypothetical protein